MRNTAGKPRVSRVHRKARNAQLVSQDVSAAPERWGHPTRHLLAGVMSSTLLSCGQASPDEITWLDWNLLDAHLDRRGHAEVPASGLLSDDEILCAAGSYAFRFPAGYEAAEKSLTDADYLPVDEGDGLLIVLDENRDLRSVSTLSVWSGPVVLAVGGPLCLPAASAQVDLHRDRDTIVVSLEHGN